MYITTTAPGSDGTETFEYDAPNRYQDVFYMSDSPLGTGPLTGQDIVIGRTAYGRSNSSNKWTMRQPADPTSGASWRADVWLNPLLSVVRVQRSGNVYQVEVKPEILSSATTMTQSITVVVRANRVVSENIESTFRYTRANKTTRSRQGGTVHVTYSAFGTSPPVTVPPASEVSG